MGATESREHKKNSDLNDCDHNLITKNYEIIEVNNDNLINSIDPSIILQNQEKYEYKTKNKKNNIDSKNKESFLDINEIIFEDDLEFDNNIKEYSNSFISLDKIVKNKNLDKNHEIYNIENLNENTDSYESEDSYESDWISETEENVNIEHEEIDVQKSLQNFKRWIDLDYNKNNSEIRSLIVNDINNYKNLTKENFENHFESYYNSMPPLCKTAYHISLSSLMLPNKI
jgi:hypothetical protein